MILTAVANHMGLEGYVWFYGVVEDRRDPEKLGRLKVRVFSMHSEDKTKIPTCELIWAHFQNTNRSASMNGLGFSPTGPVEGTHVFGYFRDNHASQDPVVVGTLMGVPQDPPNPQVGFNDPGKPFHREDGPRKIYYRYYPNDGTGAQLKKEQTPKLYPRTTHPWGAIVGESDVNRLATNEKFDDTIQGVKRRQRDVGVPIAFAHTTPGRKWNEPITPADPIYPFNHVYESESGHVIEVDDTFQNERLHLYHQSGTFVEIYGNPGQEGDWVMKVVGNHYQVVMEHSFQRYQHALNVTVQGETNIYCQSNANLQVDGNLKVHVGGDLDERIHGNHITHVDGSRIVRIGGNDSVHVKGNREHKIGGDTEHHTGGEWKQVSGGNMKLSAGGRLILASSGMGSWDSNPIHLNSGFGSPEPPQQPSSQQVPPFPDPRGRIETRSEDGKQPEPEEKPDPAWDSADQEDC